MARMIKAIAVILLIYTIYIYTLCVSKVCHRLSLGPTLALPGAFSSLRLFVGTVCRRLVSLVPLVQLFHRLSFKYSSPFLLTENNSIVGKNNWIAG